MGEELITFSSIADAMSKGRNSFKSSFTVDPGDEGNEDAKSYEVIFNAQWNAKAKPLASKIAAFFVAIYKVGGMTDEELKVEPGISNTQEVVSCRRQIITKLHPEFIRKPLHFLSLSFPTPSLKWSSVPSCGKSVTSTNKLSSPNSRQPLWPSSRS